MERAGKQGERGPAGIFEELQSVEESLHGLPASEGGFRHKSSVRPV